NDTPHLHDHILPLHDALPISGRLAVQGFRLRPKAISRHPVTALSPARDSPVGCGMASPAARAATSTRPCEHRGWAPPLGGPCPADRKSTRLNSSHVKTSYAVS